MIDLLTQWPAWYLLLVAYCIYLGIDSLRHFRTLTPYIAKLAAAATTPLERGRVAGFRARHLLPVLAWPLGGLALLWGGDWIRALLLIAFAVSGRYAFRGFAIGYAEGRKASELASSIEYVHGRIPARRPDYVASGIYIAMTHLLPIAALLYAIWRL